MCRFPVTIQSKFILTKLAMRCITLVWMQEEKNGFFKKQLGCTTNLVASFYAQQCNPMYIYSEINSYVYLLRNKLNRMYSIPR